MAIPQRAPELAPGPQGVACLAGRTRVRPADPVRAHHPGLLRRQHGGRRAGDQVLPGRAVSLRLPALRKCLRAVAEEAFRMQASVHLARLPEWPAIEAILLEELAPRLEVYVYDEPPRKPRSRSARRPCR